MLDKYDELSYTRYNPSFENTSEEHKGTLVKNYYLEEKENGNFDWYSRSGYAGRRNFLQ